MRTFLLFLCGSFKNHEDVEFFCTDIFGFSPAVKKVKYIVGDDYRNAIIIFNSDLQRKQLAEELQGVLFTEIVKYYFLFDRETIFSANLPSQMKDFIFKTDDENISLRLEIEPPQKNLKQLENMDLDIILEKIESFGVNSLTPEEKKFLDTFDK